LDTVVEVALENLTDNVNTGTGLIAPGDKKAAVEALQHLTTAGYSLTPSELEAWASVHGWTRDGATQLRQVAEGARQGRLLRVIGGGPAWAPNIVELWREEAARRAT
jgi:hypothetical protein